MFFRMHAVPALQSAWQFALRHGEKHGDQFDKLVALLGIEPLLDRLRAACPEAKNSAWRLVGLC